MPPTKSIISTRSYDGPSKFSDHSTVINKHSTWFPGPVSRPSDSQSFSRQSSLDEPFKIGLAPPTNHTYSVNAANASDMPLMTVNLHSWAKSSTNLPAYVEGQSISGEVQLNLRTPEKVKAVLISVEGYYSVPGYDAKTFLHVSETLWENSMGDPRSSSTMVLSQGADHPGKLHGKYSWSFKIDLPRTLELTAKQEGKLVHGDRTDTRLPPSLRASHGHARIGYEIVARIKRPAFRFGSSLKIPITYTVATQPGPASLLRRLAYQNTLPVPSLIDDPSGWEVLPEFQVNGVFYKSQITFTCSFALATPLSYSRGSFVPCALIVSSLSQHVLGTISNSSVPQVFLRRKLILHSELGGELTLDDKDEIISKASWIPVKEIQTQAGHKIILHGEINIQPTVVPSFKFGRIELNYDVLVYPFDAHGFTSAVNEPLLRVEVEVTTFPSEGPLPVSQKILAQ